MSFCRLLLLISLLIFGCSKPNLEGTWKANPLRYRVFLNFSDHDLEMSITHSDTTTFFNFTYEVSGDLLLLVDSSFFSPNEINFKIDLLTTHKLKLTRLDGSRTWPGSLLEMVEFTRVQ